MTVRFPGDQRRSHGSWPRNSRALQQMRYSTLMSEFTGAGRQGFFFVVIFVQGQTLSSCFQHRCIIQLDTGPKNGT